MREYSDVIDELLSLYVAKNHDYGDSFNKIYDEFGIISAIIRMQDKLNRIKNIYMNNSDIKVKDEKFEDTVKDLVNYGIMCLMRM